MIIPSGRFTLNKADYIKIGKNALIFLGPALLVLLASFKDVISPDAKYGVLVLYLLNIITDILKKYLSGK